MLFCFGLGYVAQNLTSLYKIPHSGTHFRDGLGGILFNYDNSFDILSWPEITHILISIPPLNGEDLTFKTFHEQLKKLPNLKWVGYLSATSVYANADGAWVDENYRLESTSKNSLDRQKAENLWLSSSLPIHIFRLAGIYGEHNSVLDKIIGGTARCIYKKDHVFSRIHVEDIANILVTSMRNISPRAIYNVADDTPASNMEVVQYGCKLLKAEFPPTEDFENAVMSPMLRGFCGSSKRISNHKIKQQLGVKLKYPSYKEGLDQIFTKLKKD